MEPGRDISRPHSFSSSSQKYVMFLCNADLLDLLCELVPQSSAYDRDKLFKLVLKPDMLIVMANHAAVEVRVAVVRVCA